jgi:hypothetical protein
VPFPNFKNELHQQLTPDARTTIVNILPIPPVDRDKLIRDAFDLINYLESSRYITDGDVSPLLDKVVSSKRVALAEVQHVLETYQNPHRASVPIQQLPSENSPPNPKEAKQWSCVDVCKWMESLGLSKDYSLLIKDNNIQMFCSSCLPLKISEDPC